MDVHVHVHDLQVYNVPSIQVECADVSKTIIADGSAGAIMVNMVSVCVCVCVGGYYTCTCRQLLPYGG